jgi:hypothetical protein
MRITKYNCILRYKIKINNYASTFNKKRCDLQYILECKLIRFNVIYITLIYSIDKHKSLSEQLFTISVPQIMLKKT